MSYEPTLAEIQRCLLLDPLDLHTYVEHVCGLKPYDGRTRMPMYDVVKLALCDWLDHLNVLNMIAVVDLMEKISPDLAPWVQGFSRKLADVDDLTFYPLFTLALHDQTYANWTHKEGSKNVGQFYSLHMKVFCKEMPEPAVTHLACDVTALYLRLRRKILKTSKGCRDADGRINDARKKNPRGADQP